MLGAPLRTRRGSGARSHMASPYRADSESGTPSSASNAAPKTSTTWIAGTFTRIASPCILDTSIATGPAGAQGATGLLGPRGEIGTTGAKGDIGVQGPKGDVGPQGPKER